ncbi:antibiotic biosynthesis monooxygenase [Geobacter sp. SVR]|uniref:antibiotic biosynthesis monooxygenase n=1 Tax=Geobacter sp. SVR TaxID=2495594 RepID=UPI00143EFBC0|nr:antibiotic biosynthesis monooxygenase [Geobacter sp. SVR]BCS55637.1 hypothetical protein GSVR_39450 [Geobacter sp. SVR]GCF83641.1 hypothetical protein GSbR_02410 [Geobacter sp. SVR]
MDNRDSLNKPSEPVAVLTLRTVKRGSEGRFEAALHDFISASFLAEGQLGVHVIRPALGSGSREYGIVRRFTDPAVRDAFYSSKLFSEWEQVVEPLTEGGPVRQNLSGLETWFMLPGQRSVVPPPRWKMALVTVLGVWPVSMVVSWLLQPVVGSLHPGLQALLIAVGIVVVLTWVVMPLLARLLRPWLQRAP